MCIVIKPKLNMYKRKCVKDTLHPNMTLVKLRKTQILVKEKWGKKSPKIYVNNTQIRKYQGPPKKKIKIHVPVNSKND